MTLCTSFISFGATMELSDSKSSPDPSHSDRSSVEFVAETPGPDWEDEPSTIVLSDNEGLANSRICPRLPEPRCHCTRGSFALLFAWST